MRPHEDYRDETASLIAENARLREELANVRAPRRRSAAAVTLVVADVAAMLLLRPWFNGASDVKFWAGVALVLAIGLGAVACALGRLPRGRG